MCEVQIAGGDFVQHGCEEEKVLPIDQNDLNIGVAGQRFFQMQRGIQAAKATPQDHNACPFIRAHAATSSACVVHPIRNVPYQTACTSTGPLPVLSMPLIDPPTEPTSTSGVGGEATGTMVYH